jgi:hypothetical protein
MSMADALLKAIGLELLTEYFEYLDRLRESGVTNMFGAGPYLAEAFGITKHQAKKVHVAWMETFEDGPTAEHRATKAIGED